MLTALVAADGNALQPSTAVATVAAVISAVASIITICSGIELYLNIEKNPADLALHDVLKKYCATSGLESDELIEKAKKSLTSAWSRMRLEAGSSKRYNDKIIQKLEQLPFENKR